MAYTKKPFNQFAETSTPQHIQIYGHRGARGLAPENSLPAYKTALEIGVDYVDMDLHMTKDGVVVVTHDFTLNPNLTRDKNGQWIDDKNPPLIKDLTFAELKQYDIGRLKPKTDYAKNFPHQKAVDGTYISSLEQVIEYVEKAAGRVKGNGRGNKNEIKFQVEIKTDPEHPEWSFDYKKLAKAVVDVLKKEKVDNKTELQAFDWRVLKEVQRLDSHIATAYLTDADLSKKMRDKDLKVAGLWTGGLLLKDYKNSIPFMIAKLGGKVWGPESKELTKELVDEAHQNGLKVVTWSEAEADLTKMIKEINRMIDIGVDGIISDRPDIVRELLAARGMKVPKTFNSSGG